MSKSWKFGSDIFDPNMYKPNKQYKGKKLNNIKSHNPLFDGLDLGDINMDFGNFGFGSKTKHTQSDFGSGNFFKYIPDLGRTAKPPTGYGKESKRNKARRSVTRGESPELYGMESLTNALDDSYTNLNKGAKQIKENFRAGPTRAKAFYKRKFEKDTRIPRKIIEKVKAYRVKRKISSSLQPEYESNIGFDRSKEISSTYGKTIPDPRYELPERKYDYDDDVKEKGR